MAQPPAYSPVHSFITDAAVLANFPGQSIDVEFNAVKTTTDAIRANLALIQRDDGGLANGIVTYDSLAASLQSNGLAGANSWVTATAYLVGTAVYQNGSLYRCAVAHTSGIFATDLAAGYWTLVVALPVGAAGTNGINQGFKYTFNSATSGDPTTGKFLFNNATFASATAMNISETDGNANALASLFATLDDSTNTRKCTVYFVKSDGTAYFSAYLTGTLTDSGTYDTFSITPIQTSGTIANGDVFYLTAVPIADKGADGTIAGSTGATDNRLLRADGTGGATVQSSAVSVDDTGNMTPSANDAAALGAAATSWSDLFLASGAVINFSNGTYTLTHAAAELITSGTLAIGNADTSISRASAGVIAIEGVNLTPNIPQNPQSVNYTAVLADANTSIHHPLADNNPRTFTIPANASVAYPIGTTLTFTSSANTVTIAINSDTLILAGTATTGSRTLAANGIATALKITSTAWLISGAGLT